MYVQSVNYEIYIHFLLQSTLETVEKSLSYMRELKEARTKFSGMFIVLIVFSRIVYCPYLQWELKNQFYKYAGESTLPGEVQ